jgi:hypothetical protein
VTERERERTPPEREGETPPERPLTEWPKENPPAGDEDGGETPGVGVPPG